VSGLAPPRVCLIPILNGPPSRSPLFRGWPLHLLPRRPAHFIASVYSVQDLGTEHNVPPGRLNFNRCCGAALSKQGSLQPFAAFAQQKKRADALSVRFLRAALSILHLQRRSASLIGYLGQALFPCLFWVCVSHPGHASLRSLV
jgi:hypothetical protein